MENLLFEEFYLLFSTNFYQINFFFFEKKNNEKPTLYNQIIDWFKSTYKWKYK